MLAALLLLALAVPPPATPSAVPQCEVKLSSERLRVTVTGRPRAFGLTLDGLTPEQAGELLPDEEERRYHPNPLVCFATPAGDRLLFAVEATYTGALHQYTVSRDGRLWHAPIPAPDAKGAVRATVLRREEGADFGTSVFSPDGAALTYSGATGLSRFDLATGKVQRFVRTKVEAGDDCMQVPEQRRVDIAPRWSADSARLWFTRGGFCGFEGDFVGKRMVFVPATKRLLAARPVATVAVDANGVVYYGDAGPCEDHGSEAPSHPGWIFRSQDGGASFRHLEVRFRPARDDEERVRVETPIDAILVDPSDPERLLVLSSICNNDARGSWGGDLLVTRDGGKSWRRLGPLGRVSDGWDPYDGLGVTHVRAAAGGLTELTAWRGSKEAWRSEDGGRRWRRIRPTPALPEPAIDVPVSLVTLGVERIHEIRRHPTTPATLFAATSDGLHRSTDGGTTWERIAR